MPWGETLASAWNAASDAAKSAATAVADTAQSAYRYGVDKAAEAYDYGKRTAVAAYDQTRDAAARGYEAAKQAADRSLDAAKRAAIEARYSQALGPKAAAQRAYDKARTALGRGKAGSPVAPCALASARCATLKEARAKAILANDTYREDGVPEDPNAPFSLADSGYQRLDPQRDADELRRLGINDPEEMMTPKGSDFRAHIYKRVEDGRTEYVVGYRGTQTGADWRENVRQGTGQAGSLEEDPSSQSSYSRAMRLAKKVSVGAKRNGGSVSFTGHSLGGGMASAASAVTRNPSTTFNSAGLNAHTIGGSYPVPPVPVDAYFTPTDPLSALQDNRPLVLTGIQRGVGAIPVVGTLLSAGIGTWLAKNEVMGTPVMPKAYGTRHVLPFPPDEKPPGLDVEGLKEAHGMGLVVKGIDAQRSILGCGR